MWTQGALPCFLCFSASSRATHGPFSLPAAKPSPASKGLDAIPGQHTSLKNTTKTPWPPVGRHASGKGKTESGEIYSEEYYKGMFPNQFSSALKIGHK